MTAITSLPWKYSKCIVCLERSPLSDEHIFPESILGRLVCKFLCINCNSKIGSRIDSDIVRDSRVRRTYLKFRNVIGTSRIAKLEAGQTYCATGLNGQISGRLVRNRFKPSEKNEFDGSLVLKDGEAIGRVENYLKSAGWTTDAIAKAKDEVKAAARNTPLHLTTDLTLVKLIPNAIKPHNNGHTAPIEAFALKVAYEFSAMMIGDSIYRSEFNPIRQKLKGCRISNADCFSIEILQATRTVPFHGICFEGNLPIATFQIRLFGELAIRISLLNLAISCDRWSYTHNLQLSSDAFKNLDSER